MTFFSTKRTWVKVILFPDHVMDWKEFDAWAWTCTDDAAERIHAPLFFSRYSDPNTHEQRLEIQIKTVWDDDTLTTFFMRLLKHVKAIRFAATDGSDAHAAAYATSRLLRGKGEPLTQDVIHWMLNMTGYSYWGEVRLLADQASKMAGNAEGQAFL